jgi:hypothetical protein
MTDGIIRSGVVNSLLEAWLTGRTWTPNDLPKEYSADSMAAHAADTGSVPRAQSQKPASEPEPTSSQAPPIASNSNLPIQADDIRKALLKYEARLLNDEELDQPDGLRVSADGARIRGATVVGCLDLRLIKFTHAICMTDCVFELPIVLDGANLGFFRLIGSSFPWLTADSASFSSNVELDGVLTLSVNFRGARIQGFLGLNGATLALDLLTDFTEYIAPMMVDQTKHDQLVNNVRAEKTSADASSRKQCSLTSWLKLDDEERETLASTFRDIEKGVNTQGDCLSPEKVHDLTVRLLTPDFVTASPSVLDDMFVRIFIGAWAQQAGNALALLSVPRDTLKEWVKKPLDGIEPPVIPFYGDALHTGASLFLCDGFCCFGTLQLIRGHIGGRLNCYDALIASWRNSAIEAESIEVDDDVNLTEAFTGIGKISIDQARIHGHLAIGQDVSLAFDKQALPLATLQSNGFGAISASAAHVDGNLILRQCWVKGLAAFEGIRVGATVHLGPNMIVDALNLEWSHAEVLQLYLNSLPRQYVLLDGFTYERLGQSREAARFGLQMISCQPKSHNSSQLRPQPYLQLAKVLAATALVGESRKVLIALENRKLFRRDLKWLISPGPWIWERLTRAVRAASAARRAKRLVLEKIPHGPQLQMLAQLARKEVGRIARNEDSYRNPVPLFGFLFWWLRALFWAIAGHGYLPFRVPFWIATVWLLGVFVFGAAYDNGLVIPAPAVVMAATPMSFDPRRGRVLEGYESFNRWAYSADVVLPIVDLGQERYWIVAAAEDRPSLAKPLKATNTSQEFAHLSASLKGTPIAGYPRQFSRWFTEALNGGLARVWYWTEIVLGWLLATLFVGGYAGLIYPRDGKSL